MVDKKKLYERLGALKFQKIVFIVEKLKFKIIDKFCPNIYIKYNNWCDKKVKKLCSKNISDEEKKQIIFEYNCSKMSFKKELVEKKNINYHINNNNATKFYKYLEWNKRIHKKSMIGDIVYIILSIIGMLLFNNILFVIASISLVTFFISLVIDFECINLQNYNICRLEEKKHVLKKIEERSNKKDLEKYQEISKDIYEELTTSIEMPKSETIVSKLTTREQIEQLRNLALEIKKQREVIENQKVKRK